MDDFTQHEKFAAEECAGRLETLAGYLQRAVDELRQAATEVRALPTSTGHTTSQPYIFVTGQALARVVNAQDNGKPHRVSASAAEAEVYRELRRVVERRAAGDS